MRLPSVWDDDGEDAAVQADILSEERGRRARRRRGLRGLFFGSWFSGRFGILLLCLFVFGGLGWLGFQRLDVAGLFGGRPVPVAPLVAVSDAGRELTVSEHSSAARYGRPLRLGSGGLPVVELEGSGDVRELTPFEMAFEGVYAVRTSRLGRVIEVPGPRGWGMWWRDGSEKSSLRPRLSFDLMNWRARQEAELARLAFGVSLGIGIVSILDVESWHRGAGAPLSDLVAEIRRPYPPARYGHWSVVPDQWACDLSLERDLNQGVTVGCPGEDYMAALREAWARGGIVVDRLEGVSRMVVRIDGSSSLEIYRSTMRVDLSYEVLDLMDDFLDFDLALAELRRVSGEWDLHIPVDLTGVYR